MPGRFAALTPPTLPCALLAVLLTGGRAEAHRLDAQAFLLPDHKVQIESWFGDNTIPHGAQVQVFRANGELLTEGPMNDQGIFVFTFDKPEPLRVVVSAGAGHRKELTLGAEDLKQTAATEAKRPDPVPVPLADHGPRIPVKDILIGVSFVLALAAFGISWRNARALRELNPKTNHRGTEDTERKHTEKNTR